MTLGLRLEQAGIIDMIPSLPIHTSVLIALVAGLFLAALMLRAQRLPGRPLAQQGLTTRQARTARRRVQRSRRQRGVRTVRRGTDMTPTVRTEMNQHDDATRSDRAQTRAGSGFQIRWGRTLLALLGVLALIGGVGTAIAVPLVASLTWAVPALCAGVLLISLVSLQLMAVVRRRTLRRRRVEDAMQEAMNGTPQAADDLAQRRRSAAAGAAELGIDSSTSETAASRPFDVLSADSESKGGPDSLMTLDEDGLPTSADRLFADAQSSASDQRDRSALFDQSQKALPAEQQAEETWSLREVPTAKYMVADKAERSAPEPLETESPAPVGEVKLKQQPTTPQSPEQPAEEGAAGDSLDLDQVLQRRRA